MYFGNMYFIGCCYETWNIIIFHICYINNFIKVSYNLFYHFLLITFLEFLSTNSSVETLEFVVYKKKIKIYV